MLSIVRDSGVKIVYRCVRSSFLASSSISRRSRRSLSYPSPTDRISLCLQDPILQVSRIQ